MVPRRWMPLAAFVLLIYAPLLWPQIHVGDWFAFWYVGHLVANGGSPYDWTAWVPAAHDYGPLAHGIAVNSADGPSNAELRAGLQWLWPPIVGLALAPFGMLPLEVGIPTWHSSLLPDEAALVDEGDPHHCEPEEE